MEDFNVMKIIGFVTWVLAIIGAINWGLAAFDFNLVEKFLGQWPHVVKIVYIVIAASGLYQVVDRFMNIE